MIGLPLTGWIAVSASRLEVPTLLYGAVPWPHLPFLSDLAPAAKTAWQEAGEWGHGQLVLFAFLLVALHVAGALKHQLFSRDELVLARMAPGARTGRWLEPRLFLIALGFVGVVVFGSCLTPPHPGMSAQLGAVPVEAVPAIEAPAAPAPDRSVPGTEPIRWIIEPGSTLGFTSSWSGEAISGRFDRWSADVLFSPQALDRSRVSVSIDLSSVNTGDVQRDAALPAPDFFDADNHPRATFTATAFERLGASRFVARGNLALRGVSQPLALPFTLNITGDRAEVHGVTSLDRNAFGIGQGEWANTDQIPAKVSISVDLLARRG